DLIIVNISAIHSLLDGQKATITYRSTTHSENLNESHTMSLSYHDLSLLATEKLFILAKKTTYRVTICPTRSVIINLLGIKPNKYARTMILSHEIHKYCE